jgi:hypothetical protein
VVQRAIRSACEVDYPKDRLEIQLLDDSTDDTSDIIAQTVQAYLRQGIRIAHLRRRDRAAFKAGALAEGLQKAGGELLAVFDVDFVIPKDFLRRTAPYFTDPGIGMVQARWGHVNPCYSLLTRSQAILLDGHFAIEQVARHRSGHFFNFNGTAGVWRKSAILASGGWQADTLTEDLDLSYRAQLAGWRCVFLPDLVAPAELPVEMNAFKTQQYRWTKGSIQTAKKLLPRIFASRLGWPLKREAFFHLTGFLSYPIGLLASLGVPPLLSGAFELPNRWYVDLLWCVLLVIPGACFYLCAQRELYPDWRRRILLIPLVVGVGIGLSVNNALAVLDGLFGGRSVFVRTSKFGIQSKADQWQAKAYRAPQAPSSWIELGLAVYFGGGVFLAATRGLFVALPSVVMFCLGFAYVGGVSLWEQYGLRSEILQPSGQQPAPLPTA